MRSWLLSILGTVSFLAGLYCLILAVLGPILVRGVYNAIQATQVYTMASYYAVLAIACWVFSYLCALAQRSS